MPETQAIGRDEKGRFLPGNRLAEKHGAFTLTKGKVPQVRGIRKIRKELLAIQRELEALTPDLNAKKKLLVSQIIKTQGMILLLEKYMLRTGILDPAKWKKGLVETQPAVRIYLQTLDSQRRSISALGLDTERAEKVLAPYEVVELEEKSGHNQGA